MKKHINSFLSKPKLAIGSTAVAALIIGGISYTQIGVPPAIDVSLEGGATSTPLTGSNVSLAFLKAGRVNQVLVKEGDIVSAGETLATLAAPDALGAVSQAKGALTLAQAQYAALNLDYAKTKAQQDVLVENAYQTLLKTPAEAVFLDTTDNNGARDLPEPVITGNYTLGKEGRITLTTYNGTQGPAFRVSGMDGVVNDSELMSDNPVAIGNTGLRVSFPAEDRSSVGFTWTIDIPNTRNSAYATNKNAYDLAVATRDKTLAGLAANLNNTDGASVAKAQIEAAQGAYEAALGAYQNYLIVSPVAGVVSEIDAQLKPGQPVVSGKSMITITAR